MEGPDDPKACAEILISHPVLNKLLSERRGYNTYRYELAKKYPHITRLLIEHPEYRGTKEEIDEEKLSELAKLHNIPLQTQKEQQPSLPQQSISNIDAKLEEEPGDNNNNIASESEWLNKFSEIKISMNIPYNSLQKQKELGKGGFGTVYLGLYKGNTVAIKELNIQAATGLTLEEFKREATIMSNLESPYIVQFLGASFEGTHCLVMEYMPGGSLDKFLQSQANLSWEISYQIAIDIGKGIEYLHGQGVIHCDLKSPNVLLTADKHAKLSDFGISKVKLSDTQATLLGGVGLTFLWAAPEVLNGEKHTKASDMYSCGTIFYELSTKQYPKMVKNNDDIPQDTPARMAKLIKFCWSKHPEERPSAENVVEELSQEQQQLGYKIA